MCEEDHLTQGDHRMDPDRKVEVDGDEIVEMLNSE